MRWRLDPFIITLLVVAVGASLVPATGALLDVFEVAGKLAIGTLFFLYGARLSASETLAGIRHWRLHGAIMGTTWVVFPLVGLSTGLLVPQVLPQDLQTGVLLLCLVPSTVQSSVAYTGIAGGNVAGAVVSASMSNVVGVFLTPFLVGLLMSDTSGASVNASSIGMIVAQLLAPFIAGQVLRRWIGRWVQRYDRRLKIVDRGSILLIVFIAFSQGRNHDIWTRVNAGELVVLVVLCLALLALMLAWCVGIGRVGFDRADRLAILFCGSHKSLASGLPMAAVLFADDAVALAILPLMLYHQAQLIACAWIAAHAARTT